MWRAAATAADAWPLPASRPDSTVGKSSGDNAMLCWNIIHSSTVDLPGFILRSAARMCHVRLIFVINMTYWGEQTRLDSFSCYKVWSSARLGNFEKNRDPKQTSSRARKSIKRCEDVDCHRLTISNLSLTFPVEDVAGLIVTFAIHAKRLTPTEL